MALMTNLRISDASGWTQAAASFPNRNLTSVALGTLPASGTAEFVNAGFEFLFLLNTGASAAPVTVTSRQAMDSNRTLTYTHSVSATAAGGMLLVGPFKPRNFANASGQIAVAGAVTVRAASITTKLLG